MTIKNTPYDLLRQASEIISERGENYGGIEDNFQLIADLSSLRLGRDFHPYEIAVIMACVKNARSFSTPDHMDSHIDNVNYEIFAAVFASDYVKQRSESPITEVRYQKKAERKVADISSLSLPTSNVETLKPKPNGKSPVAGKSFAVDLESLEDEIITPA